MECVANVLKGLQTSVHIGSSTTRYIYADRTYTIFPVQSLKATVWSHPEDPSVQELLLELGVLERQEPLFSLVGNMTIRTIWILWHNGNQYSRRFPLSKFHPIWIALKLFKKQTWCPTNLRKKNMHLNLPGGWDLAGLQQAARDSRCSGLTIGLQVRVLVVWIHK